ncbi:PACE efflux transporter [Marinobacter nanhaiticus D15-8W]|uniref:PACE efflux transporter n=1 Tax=Marinobacter nanhaiticus D15-8W TaxID=626887 RepID=N6W2L4_9GAMM|nr:PACE efflux transporter [Marinobacter nanhaiticus]ENO16775.1 PACE efflux transporter [Marinobacter nanhaiticus D15-8W]BES72590.1 PACE efflux transporter [Marinobacter nanhaiticus D15-8W]
MRTRRDRIRQAVSFELIGLILVIPLASLAFHLPVEDTSVLGVIGASMATGWNYLYNLLFDHGLKRWRGTTRKTWGLRVVHAFCFELGLMLAFLPVVAWWLGVGFVEALVMDVAFVVFYLVYAFVFTWVYDSVFPDEDVREASSRTAVNAGTNDP